MYVNGVRLVKMDHKGIRKVDEVCAKVHQIVGGSNDMILQREF